MSHTLFFVAASGGFSSVFALFCSVMLSSIFGLSKRAAVWSDGARSSSPLEIASGTDALSPSGKSFSDV
jgi:hypothetical protein